MFGPSENTLSHFFVAGINYKKTDAVARGQYAVNSEQYLALLKLAPAYGINELFVVSTCNRTEIYGFAGDADTLCHLLCTQTAGSYEVFCEMAYIRQGESAIEHLFDVAAGLDSQILGDYEIVGQLKTAVKFSKEQGCIGVFTERLVNTALQSSKNIKTNTQFSGGTVSVSFAAVQYIKDHCPDIKNSNILLLGTGKIGRNTCKNLVDYLGTKRITLINRTASKARELAGELGLRASSLDDLDQEIEAASVILLATNSTEPVILNAHLENRNDKLIIDLSIPYNVEANAGELPNITLVNVDELSKIKDETLHRREAEIPRVKAIIAHHLNEFIEWHELRKNVPLLKAVKTKLQDMQTCELYINYTLQRKINAGAGSSAGEKIQKVVNLTATKLRDRYQGGCNFIQAINDYMETAVN
jgi:glutamyl-tRNA reductase